MTAARLWPSERWPTPDEWREWFLSLDAPAQYEAAALVITAAQAAHACATHGHHTDVEVDDLRQAAYAKGWNDHARERCNARREYMTDASPANTGKETPR